MFGVDPTLTFRVPPDGDLHSMRVAELQHQLVSEWSASGRRPSAEGIAHRWGTSIQTISRVARGERWAGETVLAALATATRPVNVTKHGA